MWHVIAEAKMICSECLHRIPAGTECLSQMPVEMPDGFRRGKYENYCINCPKCEKKGYEQSCYVRRLSHWYIHKETTEQDVSCGHCRRIVPEGTRTVAQKRYAWLNDEADSASDGPGAQPGGTAVAAATVGAAAAKPTAGGWDSLSVAMKGKFRSIGLGGSRGARTQAMARRVYENRIPTIVRRTGEDAVKDYLKGKHGSHIKSVVAAPGRSKWPSNMVFEDASKNLSRGSRNMTAAEVAAAKSTGHVTGTRLAANVTLKSAARSGGIAAAIELPIAALENFLHCRRGRKTGRKAAIDTTKSTATAAGFGAAAAVGAKVAVGAGLSMGPFGIPVAVGGGVLLVGTTVYRVARAASRDLPLTEFRVFFCKNRECQTGFAQTVSTTQAGRLVE
jgi:hypothetical protein